MEKLKRILAVHPTLALDTSIFIYHFEAHPRYLPLTSLILDLVATGKHTAIISELLLLELLVKPLSLKREGLADQYEILLNHFPNLKIQAIQRTVIRRAARLRGLYKIKTPDAIHLATSIESGASLFICNDKGLRPVKGVKILILDTLY